MHRGSRHRARNDWRGSRFVFWSLVVTALSSIFFFAFWSLSPTIKEGIVFGSQRLSYLTQSVSAWTGMRVQKLDIEIMGESAQRDFYSSSKMLDEVQRRLSGVVNSFFWTLNLSDIQGKAQESGWVKQAYIRRQFPGNIKLRLEPRSPALLLRSNKSWIVFDQEAIAMFVLNEIPGWLSHLPLVYGLQERLTQAPKNLEDLNRNFDQERKSLQQLCLVIEKFQAQLGVQIDSVELTADAWSDSFFYQLNWQDKQNRDIQIKLSQNGALERLSSLQVLLSEPKVQSLEKIVANGELEGRWILEMGKDLK